jgi:hypothetical protein
LKLRETGREREREREEKREGRWNLRNKGIEVGKRSQDCFIDESSLLFLLPLPSHNPSGY